MRNVSTNSTSAAVDTNIVIYAYDSADADKQARAQELLQNLIDQGALTFSAQVPNEFYARITRPKRPPALSHDEAVQIIETITASAVVVPLTYAVTRRALDAVASYRFNFWDALIWASAREYGVGVIYTEDLPSAPVIEGVRYINPFA